MNRLLAVFAAALVAVAVYAVAAPASEQAVTPKQFAALSKKVKNIQTELAAFENCITQAVPVAQYGDLNGNYGYLYETSTGSEIFTTGLDIADSTSSTYVLITNAQCAQVFNSGKKKVSIPHLRAK